MADVACPAVLVRLPGARSRLLRAPTAGATWAWVKLALADVEGVPRDAQRLLVGGREARDAAPLPGDCSFVVAELALRVCGGKGGFGALLRNTSRTQQQQQSSNQGASRDLSGRRLRHVEAERAIADWNREEHNVDPREVQRQFKLIKSGRSVEHVRRRMCVHGNACKFRESCP
jgi:hypothetical protein